MNNSEIIAVIMQKNKKSGISEIQKYRLLHLVAKYGTAADLKEYFEKYGVPPCCGEAYAHAFQYDDKEKTRVLINYHACFDFYTRWKFVCGIYRELFYFFLAHPSEVVPARGKGNIPLDHSEEYELAQKYVPEPLSEPEMVEHNDKERVEMIRELISAGSSVWFPYSKVFLYMLLKGSVSLAKECLEAGLIPDKSIIRFLDDREIDFWRRLSEREPDEIAESIRFLHIAAEKNNCIIKVPATLLNLDDSMFHRSALTALFEYCDLKAVPKGKLIERVLSFDDPESLETLLQYDYLGNTAIRANALQYAEKNNLRKAEQWFNKYSERIIAAGKKKSLQRNEKKKDDSDNSNWFKHKDAKITGFSKAGLKEIGQKKIHSVTIPTVMGGVNITEMDLSFSDDFADTVPDCKECHDKKTGSGL